MMSYENIVWSDWRAFPYVVRTWVQRTSIDDVGSLRDNCSPLLGKGLILACSVQTLSD